MCNDSINTFSDFLTSFNGYRKKRKIVKDEKKLHGAVDKSSSEQHFCINRTQLPLLCENSGAILLVLVGLTAAWQAGSLAGWQSDEIREDLKNFGILY